ncbi:uncharacterized protein RHOBADRAFT_48881 [Rhodotorula graminis WP1]|uniref:ABC transporter domain-containing protein n=1 Tax=Rhodotorula graminis (strain WP1) TaxID=578459 RepID=A0A0P9GYZ3_RHOGW|nr:uncharacterized protein RHOBADRAFT_48881 [Rhodotorula graminis WP1]KPV72593.1 hypothetical protein RHOBADRAFT_48881 [Rhodotorula graminis WP1]
MAPAQSNLARSTALLTSMQTKGGAAIVGTLFALLYLRRKLAQAAQDAQDKRGARELLVPTRGRVSKVVIRPTKASTFARHRPLFRKPPPTPASSSASSSKPAPAPAAAGASAQRVGVNREFFRQLGAILRIIIPHATSKEVWLLGAHTTFLLLRTYLSLLVAQLDGKLVGDLVSANGRGFLEGLAYWFLLAIPSVYTNAMIRLLQSKLAISFRTRLTRYVHDLYLDRTNTFYKVVNLDSRIGSSGADQFVTTDVNRFCETLSALYSNVSKPSLDLILFNIQLGRSIGGRGSALLLASYAATVWILRKVTPAFGKLAAIEAKLEGDFRAAHSRLIINSEEIAFYDGAPIEKDILTRAYLRLIKHINSIFKIRILYGMTEDFVIKYLWSASGYCLISIPVFFPKAKKLAQAVTAGSDTSTKVDTASSVALEAASRGDGLSVSQRTQNYISNRRLLLSLADAGGRLMLSWKDLSELAGSTSRVYTLLSTLHDLSGSTYAALPRPADLAPDQPFYDLGSLNGLLVDDAPAAEGVSFDKVPIVAPAPGVAHGGEELVKRLSLRVRPGEHLLITGGNGSGKTAIARVLAGLWPVFEGVVARPADEDIMFLPQRPYLSNGSLRDQIIYPHSYPDFAKSGKTDADLMEILRKVHLSYLPAREGGYDVRKEWKDILSGGEKQRMGMARLFYHLPKYGVLDECTSAVSTDVEGSMYQHAKDVGITLITISHRPSLFQHHLYLLRLTGDHGQWEFTKIGEADQDLSFQKEIESLKSKLAEVESWKARLTDIDDELHFKA